MWTTPSRQLHVKPINTNGYFKEVIGETKIFDHFHKFYFSINLTQLECAVRKLAQNMVIIEHKTRNDTLLRNQYQTLKREIESSENILEKLTHFRVKRGLVNVLGKTIKFITGNLDNDDLANINQNLEILSKTQKQEISRLNELTSFAAHVTQRYNEDISKLNHNMDETAKAINLIQSKFETLQVINHEIFNAIRVRDFINCIERTINLAKLETPNLELFTRSDLADINQHLMREYDENQILYTNNTHLFEVLDHSKILLMITNKSVIMVLKIPILKPTSFIYSRIYPIPNTKNKIILLPAKYFLQSNQSELWSNDCRNLHNQSLCHNTLKNEKCSLENLNTCQAAETTNDYRIIQQMENTALMVSTKQPLELIENCEYQVQKLTVQYNVLISSSCSIIIENTIFRKPGFNRTIILPEVEDITLTHRYEVLLKEEHLQDLQKLQEEARFIKSKSIIFNPLVHYTHYSATAIIFVVIVICIIVLCYFRNNVYKNLCKKRNVVNISAKEFVQLYPKLSADAQDQGERSYVSESPDATPKCMD